MLFIFDMGGVVTSNYTKSKVTDWLGISYDDYLSLQSDFGENLYELLETGRITIPEYWKAIERNAEKKGLVIPPVNHDLFRFTFHPKLNNKTVEIIKNLRKKHRVVCGTNTQQNHWENHMERGDYAFFDQTYASNKIGVLKPSPLFYTLIMKAEDYQPSETFFVDDTLKNVLAAKNLGINAVHFTTAEALEEEWKKYY